MKQLHPALAAAFVAAVLVGASPAASAKLKAAPGAASAAQPQTPAAPLDINTATVDQLQTLPGIDPALAQRIVAHRPYYTKSWLVTRQVVPEPVFHAIKNRIVAVPKSTPKGPLHSGRRPAATRAASTPG